MKIDTIRINGIREPIGFAFPHLSLSWKVTETPSRRPVREKITVAADGAFTSVLYEKEGAGLRRIGEKLSLALKPRTRYYVRVETEGDAGDEARGESFFETGKADERWEGCWIAPPEGCREHPEFLRRFTLDQPVRSARLYQSGLGLYEAFLNGRKAGNELLAPGCTDYAVTEIGRAHV